MHGGGSQRAAAAHAAGEHTLPAPIAVVIALGCEALRPLGEPS